MTKQDLETFYETKDPWGFETHKDDKERKKKILKACGKKKFERAIDIGAGEGFITKDLPAKEIEGQDISEVAMSRLPKGVKAVTEPTGKYDLIVATGVFYQDYDYKQMQDWIKEHASGLVVTCNIVDWEINELPEDKLVSEETFKYREYTQHLCVYNFEDAVTTQPTTKRTTKAKSASSKS